LLASRIETDTNVLATLGVRNRNDLMFQEPEDRETPISMRFALIFDGQAAPAEGSFRIHDELLIV